MKTIVLLLDFVPNQNRTFESFLLRIAHQLLARDWQSVFVFSGEPSDAFAGQLRQENATYLVTKFPLDARRFRDLATSLSGRSPDAMTNMFISPFDPFLLRLKTHLGIRYWIVHDHSSGVGSPKAGLKRILAKFRGWYYGRHVDRILAVSDFVARRNVEQSFLSVTSVKVLPNGVDLDRFRPSSGPHPEESDGPVIAFVGQFIPQKGISTLLRALVLLRQRPVPVLPTLVLAGSGPQEGELRAFASENLPGQVRFLGQVSDVQAIYHAASVVVVPSEWAEAFGLVVAEAQACGACVLAADIGGIPDVIGPDGEGGRLFRSGDPADLAEKLLELLSDPAAREAYRERARARAERLFGLDNMVNGFIKEFQDVTGSK